MNSDIARPTPEHFLSLIRDQQRGRLKIYLGFAPGVGKTYEMLQEGQRLKRQGVDVAIGIVETHGRVDTAAMIGDRVAQRIPLRGDHHSWRGGRGLIGFAANQAVVTNACAPSALW